MFILDEFEDEDDEEYMPGEVINATDVLELGKKRGNNELNDGSVVKQSSLDDGLVQQPTMSYERIALNSNVTNDIDSIPKESESAMQQTQYSNVEQDMQRIRFENEIAANVEHESRPIEEPIRSNQTQNFSNPAMEHQSIYINVGQSTELNAHASNQQIVDTQTVSQSLMSPNETIIQAPTGKHLKNKSYLYLMLYL